VWYGVVWCGVVWMERFSGTEILNTRRVDAACEGSVRSDHDVGGDYPCNYSTVQYSSKLQSTVRNVLYCAFLFSF
jgi:hypothetical protein